MTPYEIYKLATIEAEQAAKAFGDNGYGCGSAFVTTKWGTPFMRWAKKEGLCKKDNYYGWILDTTSLLDKKPIATLTEEVYNEEFCKVLKEHGIHAFSQTYLT